MKQFKHIITSGCSFTDICNNTNWPLHLSNSYNVSSNHVGLGSTGNGLIARKAVYAVQSAVQQGYKPEEILVGIMWSGPDRHDTYFTDLSYQIENSDGWLQNPTHVVEDDPGGWLIMNHHWIERLNKIYYTHLHDFVNHRIMTLEKILWVQNYFDNLGIKYFMTDFMSDRHSELTLVNPNIAWLEKLVDKTKWLPVKSMHDWCCTIWSDEDFPILNITQPNGEVVRSIDYHPVPEMSKLFVKDIILPYLQEKFPNYQHPEFKEYVHCV